MAIYTIENQLKREHQNGGRSMDAQPQKCMGIHLITAQDP